MDPTITSEASRGRVPPDELRSFPTSSPIGPWGAVEAFRSLADGAYRTRHRLAVAIAIALTTGLAAGVTTVIVSAIVR